MDIWAFAQSQHDTHTNCNKALLNRCKNYFIYTSMKILNGGD